MPITAEDVRLQAVTRSLFSPTTLAKAIAKLGFVQADPIAAPSRAQDLILRHRVKNYHAGDLERRYPDLALDEDLLHVYGYLPRSVSPLLHPRTGEWGVEREYPKLAERVLEFVRAEGEIDHRQLEKHVGAMRTRGSWSGESRAATRVLHMLHYRGLLRVARRVGNLRRFVAATPPEPSLSSKERLRQLVLLLARLYAPVAERALRDLVSRLRYAAPGLDGRRMAIRDLVKSGDLECAVVGGVTYMWPAGEWRKRDMPREVRLLAPFDPIVWDRARFEHLWRWPYRFEGYTPKAKRHWGYYALPMLWGDRVIGWANTTRIGDQLRVSLGFINRRPSGRDFENGLEAERARLQAFLAPGNLQVSFAD